MSRNLNLGLAAVVVCIFLFQIRLNVSDNLPLTIECTHNLTCDRKHTFEFQCVNNTILLKWAKFDLYNILADGHLMPRKSDNIYSFKDMYIDNDHLFYWRIPKSFSTTIFNMFKILKKQENITWVHRVPYIRLKNVAMTKIMEIESIIHNKAKSKYQFTFLREPIARFDSAVNTIVGRAYNNTFPGFHTIVGDITNFTVGRHTLFHVLPQIYYLNGHKDVFLFDLSLLANTTHFNDLILRPRVPITNTINYSTGNMKERGNNFTGFLAFTRNFTTIYDQMFQEELDFYHQFIEFKKKCMTIGD